MGIHHGGNGDDVPPEGDRPPDPELPELPPEWGQVDIPDDPSALADEAERIRAELAEEKRTGRRRAEASAGATEHTSIGTPLLIMSVAVLITLVSLFAMAWSGSTTTPGGRVAADAPVQLPPITLIDHLGRQVAVSAQVPMVLLLVEECQCQSLTSATVAAAPPGVRVVTVGHSPPPPPVGLAPGEAAPLRLGDPTGLARAQLELDPPTDAATVVLVNGDGQISRTLPSATSVAQFQGDLTDLAGSG